MKCPFCNEEILDDSLYCSNCGTAIKNESTGNAESSSRTDFQNVVFYENSALMKMARESLKGKWGQVVGTFIVYFLITMGVQVVPVLGALAGILISGPMALGLAFYCLSISRNKDIRLEMIFKGFENFGNAIGAYILILVFVILWMLLLIVPGIIAAFSYSMTFYIMADNNSIDIMEAINKSKSMMKGYKWKLFCLSLRFLGWILLSVLTLGIGLLWVVPYMNVSIATFYDDVKMRLLSKEVL